MAGCDRSRLSVKFRSWDWGVILESIEACGGEYGGRNVPQLRLVTVLAPEGSDLETIRVALEAHPEVERAGYPVIPSKRATYHAAVGDDTYVDYAWQLKRCNVYHAWKYTKGSSSVKVAIIDSGIVQSGVEVTTPDYAYQSATATVGDATDMGYNYDMNSFINNAMPAWYSHGTNCWSAIKSKLNDGKGAVGVCPDVYGIMVALSDYDDSWPNCVGGVIAAADAGAKLMSISWGWGTNVDPDDTENLNPADKDLVEALQYAQSLGCIIFSAAGNVGEFYSGPSQVSPTRNYIPNEMNGVINVSGIAGADSGPGTNNTHYDDPLTNAAHGPGIDIVSPGADVFLTNSPTRMMSGPLYGWGGWNTYRSDGSVANVAGAPPMKRYASFYRSGPEYVHVSTSFASPIAMGVAALIWSANPDLEGSEVIDILKSTADVGRHEDYYSRYPKAGIANAGKGVAKARSTLSANVNVPIPYLGVSGADVTITVEDSAVTTTLSGTTYLDIDGFVNGRQVEMVELFIGSRRIYLGPPTRLSTTATAGTGATFKIRAFSSTSSVEETYTDILLSEVALATVPGFTVKPDLVRGNKLVIHGLISADSTVTVT